MGSFCKRSENFFGNKSENDKELSNDISFSIQKIVAKISIKLNLLHSRLEVFPKNLGVVGDKQGTNFSQDTKIMDPTQTMHWKTKMRQNSNRLLLEIET